MDTVRIWSVGRETILKKKTLEEGDNRRISVLSHRCGMPQHTEGTGIGEVCRGRLGMMMGREAEERGREKNSQKKT